MRVLLVAAACGLAGCSAALEPNHDGRAAEESAESFLDTYVDQTGRVVRHDQGGDTVSEGQAYALLLAVAMEDRERFDRVWAWTKDNLQRPDKLFSWHWDSGVVDEQSAADADLDVARALVLAGGQFDDPGLTRAGVGVGRQILEQETVVINGQRLLMPGSWANQRPPVSFNPSYVSPGATQVLFRASKDRRWKDVERGSRMLVQRLSAEQTPPDWVTVDAEGTPRPDDSRSTEGWDAVRIPIRHAESCVSADRRIAGSLAARFDAAQSSSSVTWIARAASRSAAGEETKAAEALQRATEERRRHPTYYGDAWDALGRFMLLDGRLGGCPPNLED